MSNRNLNDPDNAFQRTLTAIFSRLSRLESRAWPGAIRSASVPGPYVATSSAASTALQLDVDRGRWTVLATGEVSLEAHPATAEFILDAVPYEKGSSVPLNPAWHDLLPATIAPSWTATTTAMRLQAIILGTVASEAPFTIALQVRSNVGDQPTWSNLKMVLLPG